MPVTIEQIEKAFTDFQKEHNYNIPVKLNIEERHPNDDTQEAIAKGSRTYASYQQSKQQINVYRTAPFGSDEQLFRAIRHELVGHYGIDTFAPIEKRVLLDAIIQSRNESDLTSTWNNVEKYYPTEDKYIQAEEVYAVIAEIPQEWIKVKSRTINHDPEQLILDLSHKSKITGLELRTITESVDNGIIAGLRQTQNIREHDGAAFSKNVTLESIEVKQNYIQKHTNPIGTKMSATDWKDAVTLVGSEQIALPKQNSEYAGKVILVTDTHLVQLTNKNSAIAHDLSQLANAKDIEQLADTGQLQGKHFMLKYDQAKGVATALKITTPVPQPAKEISIEQSKAKSPSLK